MINNKRADNVKTLYVENLTAEICDKFAKVLHPDITDNEFLETQALVRNIIAREFVYVNDGKPEIRKPK